MGPYKSALIAAPVFYCAQGAAIEEPRNRRKKEHILSIAPFLLQQAKIVGDRRNRKGAIDKI